MCLFRNRSKMNSKCSKNTSHRGVWGSCSKMVHLSAAIPGGWPRGTPGYLPNDVYKSTLPKTKVVLKKATNTPPLGAKKCALPSQKMQYFKRVLLAIIYFLFCYNYTYELIKTQWLFIRDPYTDLYLLFIWESSEYLQYSYLFMAAPVRSVGTCYSFRTLFTDLLHSVFSSYVFYHLNLVLLLFASWHMS